MSCPNCSKVLDDATAVHSDTPKPEPGDLSVCIYCGTMLRFETVDPFTYHVLTKEEVNTLPAHVQFKLRKIQWHTREVMREKEKKK